MNIKEKLKNIPNTKHEVLYLQNEYNCNIAQAEKMKELGLIATSEKCLKASEEIYQEIQEKLSEYKRLIAAVKSVEGLQGMILQMYYFERKTFSQIADKLNYNSSYIKKLVTSAIKIVEKVYQRIESGAVDD